MNRFYALLAEILEVDESELSLTTDFRTDIPDWDSMRGFSILCMLDDEYDVNMGVPEFLACESVGDLYKAVGSPAE